jgi:signal transduction histidine kinase
MGIQVRQAVESVRDFIKNHGHHFTFGLSILSMTLLIAWWSVFLHSSIKLHRSDQYRQIQLTLDIFSLKLGMDQNQSPEIGVLKQDERFEIVSCQNPGTFSRSLAPRWGGYCIRVREAALAQIEEEFRRKKLMLAGESGLLFLLILLSIVFLYKFIQLERRSTREITEFWGRTTHEIKTPITGIKLFLQSLKNRSLDMNDLTPYVELALKQVDRQEQLAENILAGSHLRGKDAGLNMTAVNLEIYIQDYFHHALHLANAAVNLDIGEKERGAVVVLADVSALKVILDNITENAVKYGPADLKLEVRLHAEGNRGQVTIADNGPGFPPGFKNKPQSTGLGLYISKKLAQKMGGDLKALDVAGKSGASFLLQLNRLKG